MDTLRTDTSTQDLLLNLPLLFSSRLEPSLCTPLFPPAPQALSQRPCLPAACSCPALTSACSVHSWCGPHRCCAQPQRW
jgi:hypothetical protein